MSSVQNRLKLSDKSRAKQTDNNDHEERKPNLKGVKRKLSTDTEVSNNKKKNLELDKNKPKEICRISPSNRLILIRENYKKDLQASSKHDNNRAVEKSSQYKIQPSKAAKEKELQATSKLDNKREVEKSSQYKNQPSKAAPKSSNYKIPKKSVNERLKIAANMKGRAEDISVESSILGDCYDDKSHPRLSSSIKKRKIEESVLHIQKSESSMKKSDHSFRLSKEYIVISEDSDSESSSKTLTPVRQRLKSVDDHSIISISDETLTPRSEQKAGEKDNFKTPSKSQRLRIPLNRNHFSSGQSTVEVPVNQSSNHRTSIFGATGVYHNNSNETKSTGNIFSVKEQSSNAINNNNISPILQTQSSTENIFHSTVARDTATASSNIFNVRIQSHESNQSKNSIKEPRKTTIVIADDSTISKFGNQGRNIENRGRRSINERLSRNRMGICGNLDNGNSGVDNHCTDELMESSQSSQLNKNNFGSQTEDEVSLPPSANKCPSCLKESLIDDWLTSHQCVSRNIDESLSDSLYVNVNDSIFNKTELPDPQEDVSMEWDSIPTEVPSPNVPLEPEPKKERVVCIVTDTNVFMHSLPKIRDILDLKIEGSLKVMIYVPWMVMIELDDLKDRSGEPTKSIARSAGRFINSELVKPNSKIIGQSVHDMGQQKDIGKSPDDKILASCLQAFEKYEKVILLTGDINLRNKALINNIETCNPKDILPKLNHLLSKNGKYCDILRKLSRLCSMIICDCCKEAYGDPWKKMNLLQNPPWSLVECTKRFQKYWAAVFRDLLLKQCQKTINSLNTFLVQYKDGVVDDSEKFNDFMKLVVELLVFLRDLPAHKGSIKKTLDEIVEIANGRS